MLIFYILLQNYNLFLYRIFFLRKHSLGIRSDIRKMSDMRLEEITFSDI